MEIVLASKSPRRIEMFKNHGFNPVVIPSDYEERIPEGLTPAEAVMYLALQKCLDVRQKIMNSEKIVSDFKKTGNYLVVAADTIVVDNNKILGKPVDEKDAYSMLRALSGRSHKVLTGVCIAGNSFKCFFETSIVRLCDLPEDELRAYIATDEPYDKAGAYAIQETFAKYVTKVDGDIDNIIGFPFKRFLCESQLDHFIE